jgi:hypothetical protein
MWLLSFISFAVAILSGLGVGSAGLLVVYLTAIEHQAQLTAQGLNLLFFLFSSGAALTVHLLRTPLLFECILLLLPGGRGRQPSWHRVGTPLAGGLAAPFVWPFADPFGRCGPVPQREGTEGIGGARIKRENLKKPFTKEKECVIITAV